MRPQVESPCRAYGARARLRGEIVPGGLGTPAGLCTDERARVLARAGEFMPWTAVPGLAAAVRVVRGAARPNGGILVDALHFDRSDSGITDVAAVPRGCLHHWRLCDAPAGWPATTEGRIDLPPLVRAMPAYLAVSLEIPTTELAKAVGPEERVRRAIGGRPRGDRLGEGDSSALWAYAASARRSSAAAPPPRPVPP